MRISDWSSDVCSSDLHVHRIGAARDDVGDERLAADATVDGAPEIDGVAHKEPVFGAHPARKTPRQFLAHLAQRPIAVRLEEEQDRKSVVKGKGVSVRVDIGGRRSIKKKQNTNYTDPKMSTKK